MSAKPRTRPRDLILPVPLAGRPGAKARGLPRTVPAVRIPLCYSAISMTCWRRGVGFEPTVRASVQRFSSADAGVPLHANSCVTISPS